MTSNPTTLPCGHAADFEEDRIIFDQCFECGWESDLRKQANRVNEAMHNRSRAEDRLLEAVRNNNLKADHWAREEALLLAKQIHACHLTLESERAKWRAMANPTISDQP